jgi:hypothetical protein
VDAAFVRGNRLAEIGEDAVDLFARVGRQRPPRRLLGVRAQRACIGRQTGQRAEHLLLGRLVGRRDEAREAQPVAGMLACVFQRPERL